MTGAPMPKGYDAVIPVEQSERIEYPDLPESFGRPSEKVKLAPGKPGQFVRRARDVVTGQSSHVPVNASPPPCSVRSPPRAMRA